MTVPVSRRTALAALGLAALGPLAGCGSDLRGTVRVGVVWSGSELATFRRVLLGFTESQRLGVSVVSLGDDAGALLTGKVARAVAPDVAILPQPGLITADPDRLADLSDVPGLSGIPQRWRDLATWKEQELGVWYKATHKSLVWYRPDVFRRCGVAPRTPGRSGLRSGRRSPTPGSRHCRSAPPTAGCSPTGSNVLWGLDQCTYEELAAGRGSWRSPSVKCTLELLADVWSPSWALPGGPARSLLVQFEDSVLDVAARERAAMVLGADFVLPVVRRLAPEAPQVDWFPVPAPPGGVAPVVVGGDLAVLLVDAGPGGRELIEWLATADAARGWAATGGFVSLRKDVVDYPPQYRPQDRLQLLDQVRQGAPGGPADSTVSPPQKCPRASDALGFDLSDQLSGGLSGGDGRGLWRLLQRFMAELGRGGDPGRVVDRTVTDLVAAAESGR